MWPTKNIKPPSKGIVNGGPIAKLKPAHYLLLRGDLKVRATDRVVYAGGSIGGRVLKYEVGMLVGKTGYFGVARRVKGLK